MNVLPQGYYDITFTEEVEEYGADPDAPLVPQRVRTEVVRWLGARVLMRDGQDLIIEHYPVGWVGVVRRIDRVSPAWAASMTFTPIEVPDGLGD